MCTIFFLIFYFGMCRLHYKYFWFPDVFRPDLIPPLVDCCRRLSGRRGPGAAVCVCERGEDSGGGPDDRILRRLHSVAASTAAAPRLLQSPAARAGPPPALALAVPPALPAAPPTGTGTSCVADQVPGRQKVSSRLEALLAVVRPALLSVGASTGADVFLDRIRRIYSKSLFLNFISHNVWCYRWTFLNLFFLWSSRSYL